MQSYSAYNDQPGIRSLRISSLGMIALGSHDDCVRLLDPVAWNECCTFIHAAVVTSDAASPPLVRPVFARVERVSRWTAHARRGASFAPPTHTHTHIHTRPAHGACVDCAGRERSARGRARPSVASTRGPRQNPHDRDMCGACGAIWPADWAGVRAHARWPVRRMPCAHRRPRTAAVRGPQRAGRQGCWNHSGRQGSHPGGDPARV